MLSGSGEPKEAGFLDTRETMAKSVRASVVGFGKMGMLHSSILGTIPGVELVSVVEPQSMLRYFGPKAAGVPFRKDLATALARDCPEVVYITTPTGSHPTLALEALEGGAQVFIEKPLGPTVAACQGLANGRGGTGSGSSMVGYCKRFAPTFAKARDLLMEGAIGQPRSFHGTALVSQVNERGHGWRYVREAGGGSLAVIGCHLLDLLRWSFGEPTKASGTGTAIHSASVDDEFHGRLEFGSRVSGTFDVSWSRPGHRVLDTTLEVSGEGGRLNVTDDWIRIESAGKVRTIYKQELSSPMAIDLGGPEYCLEDEAFIAAVAAGRPSPIPLADAFATQQLVESLQLDRPLARRQVE